MILFEYPVQARFGRIVPKSKIYAHAGAGNRVKTYFTQQVDQVIWKYKLAPETINIPATKAVPEIQIFAISLKTGDVHPEVLRSIDKAIPFPIIHEISYEGRVQVQACYKRPNEAGGRGWVLGSYFASEWIDTNSPRQDLPVQLDLGGLYEHLLTGLTNVAPRQGESLQQTMERLEAIAEKQRLLERALISLQQEKQFNRKVAINAQVRSLRQEIDSLKRP